MGGLASVLGGAALGFGQAAQQDRQRQFESEENRRSQIGTWLGKLAGDETAHPASRQAAIQEMLALQQAPFGKPYKFDIDKIIAPAEPPSTQTSVTGGGAVPGAAQQITMPAPPSGMIGPQQDTTSTVQGAPHPTLPLTAELTKPGDPAGIFKSPEQMAQEHAFATGEAAKATAGAQMAAPIYQAQPGGGYGAVPVSHAGTIMGPAIPNAVPPLAMSGRNLHPVVIADPATGLPTPAVQDKITNEIIGQDGNVIPNAQIFSSSMLPTQSTQTMGASGAVTTTRQKIMPKGGGGATSSGGGTGAAEPKSTAHVTRSAVDLSKVTDAPGLSMIAWATKGIAPKGGVMAERQVLARGKQLGLEPSQPVPPNLQKTIQESFVARNSAIGLIDDIMKNSQVLDSLISSGKIAIAADPDGNGILTRAADLNDREAKVAGDFGQLVEHANLLRGPLGATGFRGQEAWNALQMQRGKIMSDPRITRQLLSGMRERLLGLNNADKMILSGGGRSTENAAPAKPAANAFDWNSHPVYKPGKD